MSVMDDAAPTASSLRVFDLGPRTSWAWLTAGIALLGAAEVVAIAALAHAVLPGWIAAAIDALVGIPTVVLLVAFGSAMTGRITVDAEHLVLRFGLLGGARLPRAEIRRAERFASPAIRPVGLGIGVPSGSRQATATLGGPVVFVRVLLDRPVEVRLALFRRAKADEFVMGTGSPEQLIAALA